MEHPVVLVDMYGRDLFNQDGNLSIMDKVEAHQRGMLHRAISVFIFNDNNKLLIQRRAADKYHSPGKWSNTCCTHPSPGETPLLAAQRRLREEMGLATRLTEVFTFSYRTNLDNGLIENEFDHVFFGVSNQNPKPDLSEVSDWNWISLINLKNELHRNPGAYTPWLRKCFNKVNILRLQDTNSSL